MSSDWLERKIWNMSRCMTYISSAGSAYSLHPLPPSWETDFYFYLRRMTHFQISHSQFLSVELFAWSFAIQAWPCIDIGGTAQGPGSPEYRWGRKLYSIKGRTQTKIRRPGFQFRLFCYRVVKSWIISLPFWALAPLSVKWWGGNHIQWPGRPVQLRYPDHSELIQCSWLWKMDDLPWAWHLASQSHQLWVCLVLISVELPSRSITECRFGCLPQGKPNSWDKCLWEEK